MAIHINGSDPNYLQYSFWMILQVISIHLRYLPLQTQILAGRISDVCILTIPKSCRTPTLRDGTKKHNSNPKPPHDQTSKIHKTKGMTASKISPTYPWKIPQRFHQQFMKEIISLWGFGEVWGTFLGYVGKIIDYLMVSIHAKNMGRTGRNHETPSFGSWKFSKKYLKTITT